MRLTVRLISNLVLLIYLVSCLVSCANGTPGIQKKKKDQVYNAQKVFFGTYDSVWRAAQLSLRYPIATNNMDHGILETDYIKGDDGFISPTVDEIPSSGIRYKIALTLAKGKVDGRESVRVTITKNVERRRDFFSEPELLVSDGLEEKILFYRMERELLIDEALKKAARANP